MGESVDVEVSLVDNTIVIKKIWGEFYSPLFVPTLWIFKVLG
jgi:hypothetical protein